MKKRERCLLALPFEWGADGDGGQGEWPSIPYCTALYSAVRAEQHAISYLTGHTLLLS